MIKILVVEDEVSIRMPVVINLELEGYQVDTAEDGKQAIAQIMANDYDLMILDLMMPYVSGEEVIKILQDQNKNLPTIIMSAKDSPRDRFNGLQSGAIDYITKPFIVEELLIRVRNLVNSQLVAPEFIYHLGKYTIDLKSYQATSNIGTVVLTSKEVKLLQLFFSRPNEALPRDIIIASVWNTEENPSTRSVDNHITHLRKYFEDDPKNPKYFMSVRSVGYLFSDKFLVRNEG